MWMGRHSYYYGHHVREMDAMMQHLSTASKTGLVFLEMRITKMVNNSVAANISNGADSAATTQENTDDILVTDKHVFGAGSDDTLDLTVVTTLEVHNIPRDILEGTIPTFLEACNIPITLEIYYIPGNILEVCDIPTTDNTLEFRQVNIRPSFSYGWLHENFRQFSAM